MAYIVYKERAFRDKGGTSLSSIFKRKKSDKMMSLTAITDSRSWSLDPSIRRNYFLDTFKNGSCSSIQDILDSFPLSCNKIKKLSSLLEPFTLQFINRNLKSSEQLKNINQDPSMTGERLENTHEMIENLIQEKEHLSKISKEYELENDDLRSFVHDVQEELVLVQSLKEENTMLKAKLNFDVHKILSEAQDEINYLNSQVDIYKDYKNKYESLWERNEHLKEEFDQINLSLKEMEWNNKQLKNEIEALNGKINKLESRELVVSNALIDKEVLRERLQIREEKISSLISFLEEQEMTIQDLVMQLQRMTSHIVAKEGAAGNQIHSLKFTLNEKMSRINELEDKLHTSDLVIHELEKLRDHFRLSNCALTENMQNYKKQFNMVVSCSKKLLAELDLYKAEVCQKNVQIQRLSVFPQSASSIVQFAQLLNILKTSEEMIHSDEKGAISFIPLMKKIVEQLKGEIIGNRVEYPLYEIYNNETQTDNLGTDKCIQNERFCIEDKVVEVNLPDRYFFDYEKSQNQISELNEIIKLLQESFQRADSMNHTLEKKIISSIAEKGVKEEKIFELQSQLNSAHSSLQTLKIEVEKNDSLLRKSLCEIELERGVGESTSQILVATIENTTSEYETYIKVLEDILKYKEEKILFLEDYICNENCNKGAPENEYIMLLENEISHLSAKYANEKQSVKDLNIQVSKLQAALSEKLDHFKIVQEKLLRAEKIFEHLNNIENQSMTKYDSKSQDLLITPTEEIVVKATNTILSHSERLESHSKEKLQRETVSKGFVLHLMQKHVLQKRNLKKTIIQLKRNICRFKRILMKLRKKLKLTDCMNQDYSIQLLQLDSCCNEIKKEKDNLMDQLQSEKTKTLNLKMSLEKQCLELCDLTEKKVKIENILIAIVRKLKKRVKSVNLMKVSRGISTDEYLFKNLEIENINLKSKINELQNKNNLLSAVITKLEERMANILYVPQKENDPPKTISLEIQTELNNDCFTIEEVQKHYENVIQILQQDKVLEKEKYEIQHANTVHKMKETYEKEITNIKQRHHKQITKILDEHKQEVESLKLFHEENSKDLVNKYELGHIHLQEIDNLKTHYETLLHNKEAEEIELSKEIKELKEEVCNVISQKQKEDSILNDKIKEKLIIAKNKFKKHYKRLKKSHEAEMIELINKYSKMKNIESDTLMCNKKLSVECQTINRETDLSKNAIKEKDVIRENIDCTINVPSLNKTIGVNFREKIHCSFKEASGFIPNEIFQILNSFGSSGNQLFKHYPDFSIKTRADPSASIPIASEGLKLIIEKTENIKGNFQDVLSNFTTYQRHYGEEKFLVEKYRELLKQERIRSCSLEHGLSSEFTRAERLKLQNDELFKQIIDLKIYLIGVESDLKLAKNNYENLKKSLISMSIQRRTSEKLGTCLERLRCKVDKALQFESRLREELQDDKTANERIKFIIESNKVGEKYSMNLVKKTLNVKEENTEEDLKKCSEVTKDVEEIEKNSEFMNTDTISTNKIKVSIEQLKNQGAFTQAYICQK